MHKLFGGVGKLNDADLEVIAAEIEAEMARGEGTVLFIEDGYSDLEREEIPQTETPDSARQAEMAREEEAALRAEHDEEERAVARENARHFKAKAAEQAKYDAEMLAREEARANAAIQETTNETGNGTIETPAQPEQGAAVEPQSGQTTRPEETAETPSEVSGVVTPTAASGSVTPQTKLDVYREYAKNAVSAENATMDSIRDAMYRAWLDKFKMKDTPAHRKEWEEKHPVKAPSS